MCIHILILRFIECGHFERAPTAGSGFIPAAKCMPVLAALDRYHMQPALEPLQWPYPAPQACRVVWGTMTCRGNVVAATCFGKCAECRRLEYLVRLALWFRNMALMESGHRRDEEADGSAGGGHDTDIKPGEADTQARPGAKRRRRRRNKALTKTQGRKSNRGRSEKLAKFWQEMSGFIKDNLKSFTNSALVLMVDNIWGRYRIWAEISPRAGRFVAAMTDHYGELLTEEERHAAWAFVLQSLPRIHDNLSMGLADGLAPINEEEFLEAAIGDGGSQETQRQREQQHRLSIDLSRTEKATDVVHKEIPSSSIDMLAYVSDQMARLGVRGDEKVSVSTLWPSSAEHSQRLGIRHTGTTTTSPLATASPDDWVRSSDVLPEAAHLPPEPVCARDHHYQRSWPAAATRRKVVADAALALCGTMDRDRAARSTRRIAPIFNSWLLSIDSRKDICGAAVGVIDPNPAPEEWWRRDSELESDGRYPPQGLESSFEQTRRSTGRYSGPSSLMGCTVDEIAFLKEQGLL